jgi:hypothetical protein
VPIVVQYRDVLHFDQTIPDHLVQSGQYLFDFLGGLDEFDNDGKIFREPQDARGVHVVVRAKTGDPTDDIGSRDAVLEQKFEDRCVESLTVILVVLTDVYSYLLCWSGLQHLFPRGVDRAVRQMASDDRSGSQAIARPVATPSQTPANPRITLSTMLSIATIH